MTEIWKDIEGYVGFYQVSNLGNVRSLNWNNTNKTKNLYLKPTRYGYRQVCLGFVGKPKMFLVHRLVAQAFIPNPNNLGFVNHKDFNRSNNCVDNLEWCTAEYNIQYSVEHNRYVGTQIRNGKLKGLKIQQLTKDGTLVREWDNSQAIHLELGKSNWTISECCRGNRKSAYGYKWQYAISNINE